MVQNDEEPIVEIPYSDDPEVAESPVELQLSELSSNGLDISYTFKRFGNVGSRRVKVMVDSGASPYFISDHVARELQLPITPTSPYSVMLGDGSMVRAAGICHKLSLVLAAEKERGCFNQFHSSKR